MSYFIDYRYAAHFFFILLMAELAERTSELAERTSELAERTSELPERASELPERAPPCSPSN